MRVPFNLLCRLLLLLVVALVACHHIFWLQRGVLPSAKIIKPEC